VGHYEEFSRVILTAGGRATVRSYSNPEVLSCRESRSFGPFLTARRRKATAGQIGNIVELGSSKRTSTSRRGAIAATYFRPNHMIRASGSKGGAAGPGGPTNRTSHPTRSHMVFFTYVTR
jgi:hypothetical protein